MRGRCRLLGHRGISHVVVPPPGRAGHRNPDAPSACSPAGSGRPLPARSSAKGWNATPPRQLCAGHGEGLSSWALSSNVPRVNPLVVGLMHLLLCNRFSCHDRSGAAAGGGAMLIPAAGGCDPVAPIAWVRRSRHDGQQHDAEAADGGEPHVEPAVPRSTIWRGPPPRSWRRSPPWRAPASGSG